MSSSSSPSSSSPSITCSPEHAYYCFHTLHNTLTHNKHRFITSHPHSDQRQPAAGAGDADDEVPFEDGDVVLPLFVTWDKYTHPPPPPTSYRITSSTQSSASTSISTSTTSLSTPPPPLPTLPPHAVPYNPIDEEFHVDIESSKSSDEPHLRGCIGTFTGMKLKDGLREYALTAALHDTRFHPIGVKELPLLRCGVSLLTPFEPISSPLDWSLSKHGIHISFPSPPDTTRSRTYTSTYLPHVASHQGWSKTETILSLIRKSGYSNWRDVKEGDEVWNSLKVRRYESRKVEVGWGEYCLWMEQCWKK